MIRKAISLTLTAALLAGCMSAESYKVGTRNGEDFYDIDVPGTLSAPYKSHLEHHANNICPHGYRVVSAKRDNWARGLTPGSYWFDVMLACPAR